MLSLVQTSTRATEEAELAALNAELKELKSTDFAVRAYIETWLGTVAFLALAKVLYDWHRMHSRAPLLAIPVALLGLCLMLDSFVQRGHQRRLAREEEAKLARQRELRLSLGVNDAVFPTNQAA